MRLKDEIKQEKFKSENHKAIVNLIFTNNWLIGEFTKYLKPFGISTPQYNVLRILRGQHPKPIQVNFIIERMLDKMSNASRLVEKLRRKGFVERRVNKSDKRAVDIVITQNGLDLLGVLNKSENSLEDTKTLIEEEAKEFNTMLDKFR